MSRHALPGCEIDGCAERDCSSHPCGDPAVAVWRWGDEEVHVCKRHDDILSSVQEEAVRGG